LGGAIGGPEHLAKRSSNLRPLFASSFSRLTLAVLVAMFLVTAAGSAVTSAGPSTACRAWPLCIPATPSGWLQLAHMVLAAISGALVLWVLLKAWREQRDHGVLLPLATVVGALYFGQVFVGAIQVVRGYPTHLVILHALTTISLWIALLALVMASARLARDGKAFAKIPRGRRARDFVTLAKPLIVVLLLITTFGGLVVGGRAWPAPGLALWTMLGGALAAGGSSALNQYIDRELDKKMQRTEHRPLASGRMLPAEGLAYGLGLCLVSYYVLAGFVNLTAALLSLAGILYYVIIYSLILKGATVQNIVIGGGAGAIPPMVGWAAATGHLSLAAWILFLIVFMWTPPHFWALAIVRAKDYARAGVPMLPVVKGEKATRAQIMLYTALLVAATLMLPLAHVTGIVYLVSAGVLGLLLLVAAWRVWKIPGNKVAWTMYRWSSMYLMLIFVALMLDAVI
jgi:protoheme IX farnesyltransferase